MLDSSREQPSMDTYLQGYTAFERGKTRQSNPHARRKQTDSVSEASRLWLDGWDAAADDYAEDRKRIAMRPAAPVQAFRWDALSRTTG